MNRSFPLRVYATGAVFYEGPCLSLTVPAADGMLGVQAGHSDLLALLSPGVLRCRTPDGKEQAASVSQGILKVERGEALVLVETLERAEEIDSDRAQAAADRARQELHEAAKSRREHLQAEMDLARAVARLRAARKRR